MRFYSCKVMVPTRGELNSVHQGWEVESDLLVRQDHLEGSRQRRSKEEIRTAAAKVASRFSPLEIPEKARVRKVQEGWEVKCYVYVPSNEPEWFSPE